MATTESFIIETIRLLHEAGDTPDQVHAGLVAIGYGTEAACTLTTQALAY